MKEALKDKFGKVAVLMGGWSSEGEVSLNSGKAVLDALLQAGVDAHAVDADRDVGQKLQKENFDRAFIILHGRGGEDGVVQAAMELIDLPYTGCGVMASAISMDKLMTKRIWLGEGLATPQYEMLTETSDFPAIVERLGLPLIVKPASEGSSIGMTKVDRAEHLKPAYKTAVEYGNQVFAEQWVDGEEYTSSFLGDDVLPLVRLQAPDGFYDYEAKYETNDTKYFCPCGLSDQEERELQVLSKQAFEAVNGSGWGRVDFMRDKQGKAWMIEVNTAPGMTSHSLVPMAAKAHGLSFQELVLSVLETTLQGES